MPSPSPVELLQAALKAHGRPPDTKETFVYFVQAEGGGPIKIGRSDEPLKRLPAIQTGNPMPLRFTNIVVAQPIEEWRLHMLFRPIRLVGEWFKPHPSLAVIADAIPDESLSDVPIKYRTDLPYDVPPDFQIDSGLYEDRNNKYWAEYARYQAGLPANPGPERFIPEPTLRPITWRPEPDEGGWRNSSADVDAA